MTNPVDLGDANPYSSQFDLLWKTFDENYSGFMFTDADWEQLYDKYRPQAEAAESQTELIQVLTDMLAELEDAHIWFEDISGVTHGTYMPAIEINYSMPVIFKYIDSLSVSGFIPWDSEGNWGYAMFDSIPYIMVQKMDENYDFDKLVAFIDDHQDAPAMIIDVRMNPGGNSIASRQIVKRFCSEMTLACYWVFRDGPGRCDMGDPLPIYIPSTTLRYDGPVMILMGQGNASACEEFLESANQLPNVTLAGDTSMKEVNGTTQFDGSFPLDGGWSYKCPVFTMLDPDGVTWIQETGVIPDICIGADQSDFILGRDPILEYALEWAHEQ